MTHEKVGYTFLRVMIFTVTSFLDSEQEKERRAQIPSKEFQLANTDKGSGEQKNNCLEFKNCWKQGPQIRLVIKLEGRSLR